MHDAVTYSASPPGLREYLSPSSMLASIWTHRRVSSAIARREVEGRYRTHRLGLFWVLMHPLVMLGVYTFVFGIVFKTKLTLRDDEPLGVYALAIFTGLLTFGIFREMATRAPTLIVAHRHFVTKMIFPLESLALSELLAALFNFAVGMIVWVVGYVAFIGEMPTWHALLTPLLLVPICLAGLGMSWLLSALGTFLRDLASVVELAVIVLFHMTPIFYSIDRIPEPWKSILMWNPLAHVVQSVRAVLLEHRQPDWPWFLGSLATSFLFAVVGYAVFMKSRRAFADVL
ncbi:MAG: ABC transporter permease [Phycisphaeraceae bacterium]|nr:ABC transporter permease [Phycisphaerae bacterium]MBX3391498.1 ABC transporter permease [Phycisphaeraceae bacterium]HRJ49766.1 ABC transporter permease [Phycisphaerales bacterium]